MMQEPPVYAWSNRWFRWSVSSLFILAIATLLVGFLWLPSVQSDFTAKGLWDSICRAAGVPSEWSAPKDWPRASARTTNVVLTSAMARDLGTESPPTRSPLVSHERASCQ